MAQTNLLEVAQQLIGVANKLIQEHQSQQSVVKHSFISPSEDHSEIISESVDRTLNREIATELFLGSEKTSKRSLFQDRNHKIQHLNDEIKHVQDLLANPRISKADAEVYSKKLSALKGHLTKTMNAPSVAANGAGRWKSKV